MLFHAGYGLFSGGFVGVDVFFVISGYLITTIILTEKENGTFSLVNFYERRIRRILPALFLVMLVSLPFAWLWLIPPDLVDFSKSLVGVSTFSSNIHFMRAAGYWGIANEFKPLLHTWSLAVEEQYYVLFPLFLLFVWKFRKRWILSSLLLIAAISLAVAEYKVHNHPVETFFLLQTRLWELAIGASIAFYFLYRKKTIRTLLAHKSIDEILSLLGLLLIFYAVFVFDETVPFPGFYALVPTIGTGLIIIFSSPNTLVGRMLATKLFVSIGLISYSTYLWHQPLFAFARNRILTEPGNLIYSVLAMISVFLGYLTWRYIEKPFRTKGVFNRKTIFSFAIVGTLFFITIGLIGKHSEGFQSRFNVEQSVLDDLADHKLLESCAGIVDSAGWICSLGDLKDERDLSFAVFGDSHAVSILPAFDKAARLTKAKFIYLGKNGCLPLLGIDVARGLHAAGVCENFALRQFEFVKKSRIEKVFFIGRWSLYTGGGYDKENKEYFLVDKNNMELTRDTSQAVFESALERTVEAYKDIGVTVYIVEQIPEQKTDASRLYQHLSLINLSDTRKGETIASYSVSREHANDLQAYNRRVFQKLSSDDNVKIVNLDDYYCSADICLIGDKYHSFYRDKDHLSEHGALLVVDEFLTHIE